MEALSIRGGWVIILGNLQSACGQRQGQLKTLKSCSILLHKRPEKIPKTYTDGPGNGARTPCGNSDISNTDLWKSIKTKWSTSFLSETPRVELLMRFNSGMRQNGRKCLLFEKGNLIVLAQTRPNQCFEVMKRRREWPRKAEARPTSHWVCTTDSVDTHEAGCGTFRQAPLILQNADTPRERPQRYWWLGKSKGRWSRPDRTNENVILYFLLFKSLFIEWMGSHRLF